MNGSKFVPFVISDVHDASQISPCHFSWWVELASENIESFCFKSVRFDNILNIAILQKNCKMFPFHPDKYSKNESGQNNEYDKTKSFDERMHLKQNKKNISKMHMSIKH